MKVKVVVNKSFFEELCRLQYTEEEIYTMINITPTALNKWCTSQYDGEKFPQVYSRLKYEGQVELRRHQFDLAEKSPSMAIYLGELYLGDSKAKQEPNDSEASLKWD